MATRIYTQSSGSASVTPSTWEFAKQIASPTTVPGGIVKNTGSTMTSKTGATGTVTPSELRAMGRTVIGPIDAQTISGTVKGQIRGSEDANSANCQPAMAIKIIKPDGTNRAVLLAAVGSTTNGSPFEFVLTTLTNRKFLFSDTTTPLNLTSQTATAGDYLVIEWGFLSGTNVAKNVTVSIGNDSATDLPEDTSTTAANNPWWEFSQTINFVSAGIVKQAAMNQYRRRRNMV